MAHDTERRFLFVVRGPPEALLEASRALETAGVTVSSYGWELSEGRAAIHFVTHDAVRAQRAFDGLRIDATRRELTEDAPPPDAPGADRAVTSVSKGIEAFRRALRPD